MGDIVTPQSVERRLVDLSREVDGAFTTLEAAELRYFQAKAAHEVAYARAYLGTAKDGERRTVDDRKALTTVAVGAEREELAVSEALVRAARENTNRLRTQVDIARSVGTSVRSSMETT